MTSLLGVPVSLQDRIIGDLYLTDKLDADEFTTADEAWVMLLAQQAAVAVENARLYTKMSEARQRAQTLAELISSLNQVIEPNKLFQQITEATCQLLQLPAAALYLLEDDHSRFKLLAQVGLKQGHAKADFLPIEGSVAGQVLQVDKPVSVSNTSSLPKIYFLTLPDGTIPRALLVVPIKEQGQRLNGVLEVYSAEPRTFSMEEVMLLEAFAGQAALTLERARLYQQKEDFLSMTAHDLRAPLTAIKMSAGLLEANLPTNIAAPLVQLVANISRNSERLNTMLEDLLDLTRLEQGQLPLNLTDLELDDIVTATVQTVTPLFESKQQKLTLIRPASQVWVKLDRRRFEQILVNLLTNANKYTPSSGSVRITFDLETQAVVLRIEDTGPGIPAEEQEFIFDRYYRRAMHEQNKETVGSGLGLPIARLLTELHNGKLWVESQPNMGSTFCLKLPLLSQTPSTSADTKTPC
jgi:signal transduction histidine kinase